jgi:lipopolysaccharide export system ATP-binding protein
MYRRARLGIGYLPQEASVFRGLAVEENIRAVLEIIGPPATSARRGSTSCCRNFRSAICGKLRQWHCPAARAGVEIARAIASRPNFILLDEPFSGIDPITVGDIRSLVSHLKDRGIGVLVTDHNVRDTLDIVDRAYILYEGKVLREGRPSEIVDDETVRRVYLGERFACKAATMAVRQRDLAADQTLVMTPQLQQAIKLLELSARNCRSMSASLSSIRRSSATTRRRRQQQSVAPG